MYKEAAEAEEPREERGEGARGGGDGDVFAVTGSGGEGEGLASWICITRKKGGLETTKEGRRGEHEAKTAIKPRRGRSKVQGKWAGLGMDQVLTDTRGSQHKRFLRRERRARTSPGCGVQAWCEVPLTPRGGDST